MLLAGLYKNLGKMGDSEDCLEKALVLIKKGKGPTGRIIKWMLQLIAHKSSLKKYIVDDSGIVTVSSWHKPS